MGPTTSTENSICWRFFFFFFPPEESHPMRHLSLRIQAVWHRGGKSSSLNLFHPEPRETHSHCFSQLSRLSRNAVCLGPKSLVHWALSKSLSTSGTAALYTSGYLYPELLSLARQVVLRCRLLVYSRLSVGFERLDAYWCSFLCHLKTFGVKRKSFKMNTVWEKTHHFIHKLRPSHVPITRCVKHNRGLLELC